MIARLSALSALLVALLVPAPTQAQQAEAVIVFPVAGEGGVRVRRAVEDVLADRGVPVVPRDALDAYARGTKVQLDTPGERLEAARFHFAAAWVEGRVQSREGGRTVVELRVIDGESGNLRKRASFRGGGGAGGAARRVRGGFWNALGPAFGAADGGGGAGGAPGPAPAAATGDDDDEPAALDGPEDAGPGGVYFPLEATLGLRTLSRDFAYNDRREGQDAGLRDYEHRFYPATDLGLRWYPFARDGGVVGDLGLELRAQLSLGVMRSENGAGTEFPTSSRSLDGGPRLRFAIDEHELAVQASVGVHGWKLEDVEGQDPGVPDVEYLYGRLGVDAHLMLLSRLSLGLSLAYRHAFDQGEIGDDSWFPDAFTGALESELYVGFVLAPAVEVRAGGGYLRYFYSLEPDPAGPAAAQQRVAGGALDQYPSFFASVAWRPSF